MNSAKQVLQTSQIRQSLGNSSILVDLIDYPVGSIAYRTEYGYDVKSKPVIKDVDIQIDEFEKKIAPVQENVKRSKVTLEGYVKSFNYKMAEDLSKLLKDRESSLNSDIAKLQGLKENRSNIIQDDIIRLETFKEDLMREIIGGIDFEIAVLKGKLPKGKKSE